jgi:hypothetical protein
MTIALFQLPNGSIAVDTAAPGHPNIATPDGWTRLPDGLALPTVFRDCWRYDGTAVVVEITLARVATMISVRSERNRRLNASDAIKARLDDIGTTDQKAAWAAYRQALRDVPVGAQAEVDAITDPATLSAYAPAWPNPPTL